MPRKIHLEHTAHRGPTCQTGRIGGALRGEHITERFSEFVTRANELQCSRCRSSSLFKFLARKAAA
jgi:hypothetical protein